MIYIYIYIYIYIRQNFVESGYTDSHTSNIFRSDTTASTNALHQSNDEIKQENTTIPENIETEMCSESNNHLDKGWVSVDIEDDNLKISYIK